MSEIIKKRMGLPPKGVFKAENEDKTDPDLIMHKDQTWKQELAQENKDSDLIEAKQAKEELIQIAGTPSFYDMLVKKLTKDKDENVRNQISDDLFSKPNLDIATVRGSSGTNSFEPIPSASFLKPGDIVVKQHDSPFGTNSNVHAQSRLMVMKVDELSNKIWVYDSENGIEQVDPLDYVFVQSTHPDVAMRIMKRLDNVRARPDNNLYSV